MTSNSRAEARRSSAENPKREDFVNQSGAIQSDATQSDATQSDASASSAELRAEPATSLLPDSSSSESNAATLNAATLKIATFSDLHLPNDGAAARTILENAPFWKRQDFAVLLGDMVATYGTEREYGAVAKFVRALPKPYTAIDGNHEFYFQIGDDSPRYGAVWNENSPEQKIAALARFRRFYGLDSLWRAQHLALGSFIFLGLNGTHAHKAETLGDEQWNFLEEELRRHEDKAAYVFCHTPLMMYDRLDMKYYDDERTACVETPQRVLETMVARRAPVFWMSGHIHLRPDHYLSTPYEIAPRVWQVHCPDSWGYSRWQREHVVPQRHPGVFSRQLEIEAESVTFVAHDHRRREDVTKTTIKFADI